MEQVAQKGGGISVLGDTQHLAELGPEKHEVTLKLVML